MRKVDGEEMNKEEVFETYSKRFETDGYVVINEILSLSDEEFKNFMMEKHPNSEFIFVNDLKIFVVPEAYNELEEVLEKSFGYFMNVTTDYKVALRTLEELEDNYRNACFEDGRLVVIENGKVVRGVITEQNKKVVNKKLRSHDLGKFILKFDDKGNLVRESCFICS